MPPVSDKEVRERLDRMYGRKPKKQAAGSAMHPSGERAAEELREHAERVGGRAYGAGDDKSLAGKVRSRERKVRAAAGMDWERARHGQSMDSNQ